MGRHNQHHLVAASTVAPCASINLGLIVVLSVGSQGRNGRGQGAWPEESARERESLLGKQRIESPPFTRGSVLARFLRNVDLSAVYAGDFFS